MCPVTSFCIFFVVSSTPPHCPPPPPYLPHPAFFSISSPLTSPSRLQAVMTRVKGSFWKANLASIWMNSFGTTLFTTRTVHELLWGYEDPLLARVSSSNPDVEKVFGLMYKARTAPQKMKADVVLGRYIKDPLC